MKKDLNGMGSFCRAGGCAQAAVQHGNGSDDRGA